MISKKLKSKCTIENTDIHLKKLLKNPKFKKEYEKEKLKLEKLRKND